MPKHRRLFTEGVLGPFASLVLLGCLGSSVSSVSVAASQTVLLPGESSTLTATLLGSGDFTADVLWSIDGGGAGLVANGLSATYTAPTSGAPSSVIVRATSTETPSVSGTVLLSIASP